MRPLALACALAALPVAAPAQDAPAPPPCLDVVTLTERLASEYGEALAYRAMRQSGTMLMIYVNPQTGTYTVAQANPQGLACLLDSGEGWEATGETVPKGTGL